MTARTRRIHENRFSIYSLVTVLLLMVWAWGTKGCTQLPINSTDPVATLQTQVRDQVLLITLAETPVDIAIVSGKIKGKEAALIVALEEQINDALTRASAAAIAGRATDVSDALAFIQGAKTQILQVYGTSTATTQP